MDKKTEYGLLCNSSINIGDEIQSIAAMRFLPTKYKYIHRERVNKARLTKKTKLIMNAWWTQRPLTFPPCNLIEPLCISMHFKKSIRNKKIPEKYSKYLKKYAPIGCRDKVTEKWLKENDIEAYFSGCLTLTLVRNPNIKKESYVLGVDLPKKVVEEIKKRTNRPVYNISRKLLPLNFKNRFKLAKVMLHIYQSAHCIVTSRLHAAMPALALETPVLMLDTNDGWLYRDGRYDGLKELCNIAKEDEFMSNKDVYDFENPPKNPDNYKELREKLIKTCFEFTGYNNQNSLLDENTIPSLELLKIHTYKYSVAKRFVWWVDNYDIFKILLRRIFLKKDKFSI